MALRTVSVDSGTPAQVHARRNEMERHWAAFADPLDILIRWEERAYIVFNLTSYDDPIVDREFISNYIDNRLGDKHVRIQRKQCNARPAGRRIRDTDCCGTTISDRDASGTKCDSWHNGARVVGRNEVLLARKR